MELNFFDEVISAKAIEIFGNPLPTTLKARLDAERRQLENDPNLLEILRKGRYIHSLAQKAGAVIRFDPRLYPYLSAFLCGLSPIIPMAGFRICGHCGHVVCDEKAWRCPVCKGHPLVASIPLPLKQRSLLCPVIRVAPQHCDRVQPLVDSTGSFQLRPDKALELLCDLLEEAEMSVDELPFLCNEGSLDIFNRVLSASEEMGCFGCIPDAIPYSAFAMMGRHMQPPAFDKLVSALASYALNEDCYRGDCGKLCEMFRTTVSSVPTPEDFYYYLLGTGHWQLAVRLSENLTETRAGLAFTLTEEFLQQMPLPDALIACTSDYLVSKVYAIDMAQYCLQLAFIKRNDPVSFYRAQIRRMDPAGFGGKLEMPNWSATEALNKIEEQRGLPRTDVVGNDELIEKLAEYSNNAFDPSLGRDLLLLVDLDAMEYVDEVFRHYEKELHLDMDYDWESWWTLREEW